LNGARVYQFEQRATLDDELDGIEYERLLRDPPPRDWMVDGCFMRGTVGLVSGNGGVGKSLIMQQLATCAVLGRPWLGMHVQAGKALVLACEDDADELHRRQDAINRSLGRHMEDVLDAGLDLIARVTKDNILMELDRPTWRLKPTKLWDKLVTRCRRTGIQYVIIDTTAKTFGGNQSDPRQVGDYVGAAHRLAILINGVVLFTQHPSMYGRRSGTGESGSVQWENSVRARLYLHRHKTKGLILEGRKANYSNIPAEIPLKWSRGVFVIREPAPIKDGSNGYKEGGDVAGVQGNLYDN
jgi:RecA-family ATPase